MRRKDITFILNYYAKDSDGNTKMFKDSADRSTTRLVSLYTICRSEGKARKLGELKIGESYHEYGGRNFKRIS